MEEHLSNENGCLSTPNVILMLHGELGTWDAILTKAHMLTCRKCKVRAVEFAKLRDGLVALYAPGPAASMFSFKTIKKLGVGQVALATAFAVACIAIAVVQYSGYFDSADVSAKPGTFKTKKDVGAHTPDGCEPEEKPKGILKAGTQ